ncbi:hypothetical protein ACFV23_10775 [Streptomyces sp. NPDC059627]
MTINAESVEPERLFAVRFRTSRTPLRQARQELVAEGRLQPVGDSPVAIETTHLSARHFPGLRWSPARCSSLYTAPATIYGAHLVERTHSVYRGSRCKFVAALRRTLSPSAPSGRPARDGA